MRTMNLKGVTSDLGYKDIISIRVSNYLQLEVLTTKVEIKSGFRFCGVQHFYNLGYPLQEKELGFRVQN